MRGTDRCFFHSKSVEQPRPGAESSDAAEFDAEEFAVYSQLLEELRHRNGYFELMFPLLEKLFRMLASKPGTPSAIRIIERIFSILDRGGVVLDAFVRNEEQIVNRQAHISYVKECIHKQLGKADADS